MTTSIAEERRRLAEVGLVLRRREQWGARFDYTTSRAVAEPASQAFCHISVTNPSAYSSNDAHWRAIEKIGISRFPGTGISYNGGVLPGGVLYEGQPWGRRGAHSVNTFKRATCTTSGCPSRGSSLEAPAWNNNYPGRALVFARNVGDPVTDADVDAAARYWAAHKLAKLLTANAKIHGHRCLSPKDCPGSKVWARMDDINDLTADYVRNGLGDDDMPTAEEFAAAVWRAKITDPVAAPGQDPLSMAAFLQQVRKDTHAAQDVKRTANGVLDAEINNRVLGRGIAVRDALSFMHEDGYQINGKLDAVPRLEGLTDDALGVLAAAVADEQARRLAS